MHQNSFNHRPPKSWLKISVTVPEIHTDIIASYLYNSLSSAVEQSPAPLSDQELSYDIVTAYLEEAHNSSELYQEIHQFLETFSKENNFQLSIQTEKIIEEDWNKNWKKHFKPFKLTNRLVIKPSWEDYTPAQDEVILEMDPGMAFGTGLHDSSKLALQLTENIFNNKSIDSVLDVGTGTGILGMSCALFGATTVIGLDNDIDARVAAGDNILKNNLEARMKIVDDDIDNIHRKFDIVIANITQDVLTALSKQLAACIETKGNLVLSGILTGDQAHSIRNTFSCLGLTEVAHKESGEWTALNFIAP